MLTKDIVCEIQIKTERKKWKLLLFFFIVYAFITFASSSGQHGLQIEKHSCLEHLHIYIIYNEQVHPNVTNLV